jgi:hypothetical protein
MPLLAVSFALFIDPYLAIVIQPALKAPLLGLVGVNTFLIPTVVILYLRKKGVLGNLNVTNKKERLVPFIFTALLYGVTYYLLRNVSLPNSLLAMILASLVSIVVAFIINFYWKISLHMVGVGGLLGAILGLALIHQYFLPSVVSVVILLAGVIGASRLILAVHTKEQLYAGFTLGLLLEIVFISNELVI